MGFKFGLETKSGKLVKTVVAKSTKDARKKTSKKFKIIRPLKFKGRTIVGFVIEKRRK